MGRARAKNEWSLRVRMALTRLSSSSSLGRAVGIFVALRVVLGTRAVGSNRQYGTDEFAAGVAWRRALRLD